MLIVHHAHGLAGRRHADTWPSHHELHGCKPSRCAAGGQDCGRHQPDPGRAVSATSPRKDRQGQATHAKRLHNDQDSTSEEDVVQPTRAQLLAAKIGAKVPLAESIGALVELKAAGKIRHIGVSNASESQLREAERITPVVSVQNRYNLVDRGSDPVVDVCNQEMLDFLPWAPIQDADRIPAVLAAANSHRVSARQIALAWLLARSPQVLPIPGSGSPEHVAENVAAASIELTSSEEKAISNAAV